MFNNYLIKLRDAGASHHATVKGASFGVSCVSCPWRTTVPPYAVEQSRTTCDSDIILIYYIGVEENRCDKTPFRVPSTRQVPLVRGNRRGQNPLPTFLVGLSEEVRRDVLYRPSAGTSGAKTYADQPQLFRQFCCASSIYKVTNLVLVHLIFACLFKVILVVMVKGVMMDIGPLVVLDSLSGLT